MVKIGKTQPLPKNGTGYFYAYFRDLKYHCPEWWKSSMKLPLNLQAILTQQFLQFK